MSGIEMLYKKLTVGKDFLGGDDYYQKRVPACIKENLNPALVLRPYQCEAFGRFDYYINDYHGSRNNTPLQLLYHMATGSGKTLIMAGLMLYLYEKGFRNFLFFVNSNNVISKTRDNFLNKQAIKYLFNNSIFINHHEVNVREVTSFQSSCPDDINIVFTTIQGLHLRLNVPHENSITFDDFEKGKVVLLSDEAHHINVETKQANKLKKDELQEIISWESTVNKIFQSHRDNVLLEFTATLDIANEMIANKYQDKVIYDYPLKAFRLDGYSKEVKVFQSDVSLLDRAIQALLLSQFRKKVFAENGCLIKPVILFKSKTIQDSVSFFHEFIDKIKNLKGKDLAKIKTNLNLDSVFKQVFLYFKDSNITLSNLALEMRDEFGEDKCIIVNSKDESEQKQIAVNTLEDVNNQFRVIFAVDKLNEGWDVLNLFDIVRLYDTRDAKKNKPGKTTLSEAQLIGRGARYCPFKVKKEQSLYQRKYDFISSDDKNDYDLKVCEELYYHSAYNPQYIKDLNQALVASGIKEQSVRKLSLSIKQTFKRETLYKKGFVFKNSRIKNTRKDVLGLSSSFIQTTHKVPLRTGYSESSEAFDFNAAHKIKKKHEEHYLSQFGVHVIKKAINKLPDYQFVILKKSFPNLKSISQFITSPNYLGKVKIELESTKEKLSNLTQEDKLYVVLQVLIKLSHELKDDYSEYKGAREFKPYMIKDIFTDKILHISNDCNTDKEYGLGQSETGNPLLNIDLSDKDWFVFNENYGTSEEKYFIKYFAKMIGELRKHYKDIYLIRNERHLKIYNFDDGKAFEPDFVLFLLKNKKTPMIHYQIFIEPKGSQLLKQDEWKQRFLLELKTKCEVEQLWKDKEYIVWGLPFYNESETKHNFDETFSELRDCHLKCVNTFLLSS